MIIDSFGPYVCRTGTTEDIAEILEFFESIVCDKTNKAMYEMDKRKLLKLIVYVIDGADSLLVIEDGKLMGVYTGEGNEIFYLGNKGGVFTMAILLKTALCDIQNMYADSKFRVDNDKQKQAYESINSTHGIVTRIDENGEGIVAKEGKVAIKELYDTLRKKYV